MNKLITFLLFLLLFSLAPLFVEFAFAAPPPPTPIAIPIDGGLSVLLVAGVGYAAKKLYNNKEDKL